MARFSTLPGGARSGGRFAGGGAETSGYQRQLLPYVRREQEADTEERGRRNFLETVMDVLSTGQYATANVAEDLIQLSRGEKDAWDTPILSAASGERKGDWTDVIFGGETDKGTDLPGVVGTDSRLARGVGGFFANVLLDPTTYVGFGATAAGRAAAGSFAQAAVRQARRQLADPEVVARVFGSRVGGRRASSADRLRKAGDDSLTQYLERTYRDSYREALATPSAELRERYMRRLDSEMDVARKTYDEHVKGVLGSKPKGTQGRPATPDTGIDDPIRKEATTRIQEIEAEMQQVRTDRVWNEEWGLGRAGEGGWRFMGQEMTRAIGGPVRKQLASMGDAVRQAVRSNQVGSKFLNAWWTTQNTGVIGTVRRALGFRNPYQRIIREQELSNEATMSQGLRFHTEEIIKIFGQVRPEAKTAYVNLMGSIYDAALKKSGPEGAQRTMVTEFQQMIQDPAIRASVPQGIDIENEIMPIWSQVKQITDAFHQVEEQYVSMGFLKDFGHIANYLPVYMRKGDQLPGVARKRGTMEPPELQPRAASYMYQREQQAAKLSVLMDIPIQQAEEMVDRNLSSLIADPEAMLKLRAIAHTRMVGRAQLLGQLRDLGMHVGEVRPRSAMAREGAEATAGTHRDGTLALRRALTQAYESGDLSQIGLHTVEGEKFLEGYFFDREVYEIIQRTVRITEGDDMDGFRKLMDNYLSWWKGVVTARPGFHARNAATNQILLFLREGLQAFNPRFMAAGAAGASYALSGRGAELIGVVEKGLGKVGVGRALNMKVGQRTVREWSDYSLNEGIISRFAHSGDPVVADEKLKAVQLANPLDRRFLPYQWSQQAGSMIESSQRFQMFLLELKKTARKGLDHTDAEIEFAKMEAKKWMIDYTDLTQWEKGVMRRAIPFYAWVRHIVPNVIQGIVETPYMYGVLPKMQNAAELEGGPPRENRPEWMRDLGLVPVTEGEDPGAFVMGSGNFPTADLSIVPLTFPSSGFLAPSLRGDKLVRELAGMAHPLIQTLVEVATERDLFTGGDLDRFKEVPRAMRMLEGSPKLLAFLDGVARVGWSRRHGLGLVNDRGEPREDERGRLMMDARLVSVLENNLPLLDSIGRALDGPEQVLDALGVSTEEALEQMTGARDDYDGLDEFLRVLSFYGGALAYQHDEPRSQRHRAAGIYRRAQDQYSEDRRANVARSDRPDPMQRTYQRVGLM